MKKSLIALAALAATGAFAQSTATLSGQYDVTVESISNRGTVMNNSRNGTTNLTFQGTEDLGGGNQAVYFVSTQFRGDNMTPNGGGAGEQISGGGVSIGDNNMYVGFNTKDLGAVKLGRMNSALFTSGATGAANYTKGVSGFAGSDTVGHLGVRVANAVQYTTPTFGGFSVTADYSLNEASSASPTKTGNNTYGNNLQNTSAVFGRLAVGPVVATLGRHKTGTYDTVSGVVPSTYTPVIYGTSTVPPAYAALSPARATITQASAAATFGAIKLSMVTRRTDDGTVGLTSARTTSSHLVGANYTLPTGQLWASYGNKESHNNAKSNAIIVGVGYKHNLSKRTQLYFNYGKKTKVDTAALEALTGYGWGVTHSF